MALSLHTQRERAGALAKGKVLDAVTRGPIRTPGTPGVYIAASSATLMRPGRSTRRRAGPSCCACACCDSTPSSSHGPGRGVIQTPLKVFFFKWRITTCTSEIY